MVEDDLQKNVCRTCLTNEGNFQSIFVSEEGKAGIAIHVSEMICACTSVQITLGDGLPEEICSDCVDQTVNMYLFKIKCEESDKFLRKQITDQKVEFSDPSECLLQDILPCQVSENKNDIKSEMNLEQTIVASSINSTNKQLINQDILDDFVDFSYVDNELGEDSDLENNVDNLLETPVVPKKTKDFECDICMKKFSREDLLLRHKIAHAMKLDQDNVKIDGTFIMENTDENTIIIKTENILFSCQECNNFYEQKSDLDRHLIQDHNVQRTSVSLVCDICFKKFRKPSHLKRHRRTHSILKPFSCSQCRKRFSRADLLHNHMNLHSGAKPHTCKICFKGFNQISNLKDHMRTHNGEKPFLCSTCGKGFNQLGNLRQHTVRHSGVKAHVCSICGSGFASKGELSAHLRKHTGARPFVCNTCNHGFTTSSSLTKHKRIHSGEKPYECDVCHMKFSRSGILSRHKRTHTGEKPYVCSFCAKAFTQSNDLTSHLRIHTGEKPYICEECGQAFRQSSALKTHKKTHVNVQKIETDDEKPVLIHCS